MARGNGKLATVRFVISVPAFACPTGDSDGAMRRVRPGLPDARDGALQPDVGLRGLQTDISATDAGRGRCAGYFLAAVAIGQDTRDAAGSDAPRPVRQMQRAGQWRTLKAQSLLASAVG